MPDPQRSPSGAPPQETKVVFPLHGIRTAARWRDAFHGVAVKHGWNVRLKPWYFGNFGTLLFLLSPARSRKLRWFRDTYESEIKSRDVGLGEDELPSVVAHSFGTYILGHALLKYPFIRFDKVLLCGSILPTDFPWTTLIERGQVQAVRNEYGTQDVWSKLVSWFVRGSGPSGTRGFTTKTGERFEQAEFRYPHSEYFSEGHMENYWLSFLERPIARILPRDGAVLLLTSSWPWGFYGILVLLVAVTALSMGKAFLPARLSMDKVSPPIPTGNQVLPLVSAEEQRRIREVAVQELTGLVGRAARSEGTGRCSESLTTPGAPDEFGPWTTAQCVLALVTRSSDSKTEIRRGLKYLSGARVAGKWEATEVTAWVGMAFLGALSHSELLQDGDKRNWMAEVRHAYKDVTARQSEQGGWGSFQTYYPGDPRAMTNYATYQALQFLLRFKQAGLGGFDEADLGKRIRMGLLWILDQYDVEIKGWKEHDSDVGSKDLRTLYLLVLTDAAHNGFDFTSDGRYASALKEWTNLALLHSQNRDVAENTRLQQTQFIFNKAKFLRTQNKPVVLVWFPWALLLADTLAADAKRPDDVERVRQRLIRRLPEAVETVPKAVSTYVTAELLYAVRSLR